MTSKSGGMTCAIVCWAVGGLAGAAVTLGLFFFADWLFIQSVFIGAIAFAVLGALLQMDDVRVAGRPGCPWQRP